MRRAIEQSRNVPAVRTLARLDRANIEYAHRLGIAGDLPRDLPLALGAARRNMGRITSAFAAFGNQVLRMKPSLSRKQPTATATSSRNHGPKPPTHFEPTPPTS